MASMELDRFADELAAGTLSRRAFHRVLASVGVVTLTIPAATAQTFPIEVFTWPGYDAVALRPGFDETYGAEPDFLLYADNDEAFDKVAAGFRPTIVQPTNHTIARWRTASLLKPIDTSRLANHASILPGLLDIPALQDSGETFGVPFAWGNSSIIYRKDLLPEGTDDQSWNILWDENLAGRIGQRDSMDAVVLNAAMVLGIDDPYTMGESDLERVREKLMEQRELLAFYWTGRSEVEQALATGEVMAAYGWNASYAALKRKDVDVGYMVPREGVLTWVDCTCLIADGPGDEDEAYDYINAGLSVEAGAYLIETFGYGAANAGAFEAVAPERLADLGMEDPRRLLAASRFFGAWDPRTRENAVRMFEEIKAGF